MVTSAVAKLVRAEDVKAAMEEVGSVANLKGISNRLQWLKAIRMMAQLVCSPAQPSPAQQAAQPCMQRPRF